MGMAFFLGSSGDWLGSMLLYFLYAIHRTWLGKAIFLLLLSVSVDVLQAVLMFKFQSPLSAG